MDLRLGCREQTGSQWIYYLRDGSSMTKQQWISLVEQQIEIQGNESSFADIEKTVNLWNKNDNAQEVALQVYASKYCSHVELNIHRSINLKIVKDNMGCEQFAFR